MIKTITQWFSSNFNTDKVEKFISWVAMTGITSGIGVYSITGQIIPGVY